MFLVRKELLWAIAVASAPLAAASADSYKWCTIESEGGTNCGFVTIEQCRAAISGTNGLCEPKQVVPPNLSPAAKAAAPKIDASGGKDPLMECVTYSCKINCSSKVARRFRPKWCVYFKKPAD